jgi:LPS-assembly protein
MPDVSLLNIQSLCRKIAARIIVPAAVLLLTVTPVFAEPSMSSKPVNFQSKQLSHDDEKQTVTAIGDVELIQGDRILRADKMVYHLDTDTVEAIGNISLLDEYGNVSFAEYVTLSKDMKDGFIHSLLSLLADGSRFTATEARRENGVKTTMTDASYTPCKVCETDPKPLWQIKADKVVHNEETKSIDYKNARLEFAGVPLAWSPIFSHADPSVKRKSGFLRPNYGFDSDMGTFVEGGYYFGGISPDKDATLRIRPTTEAGVLVQGEWRQRFEKGRIEIEASGAHSDRTEDDGTIDEGRNRGHVFANGRFDLDSKWRAGFDVERASDKEYLRLYDISKENVLESEAFAERLAGRDYTRISALNFQDVRLGNRPDQPDILPWIEHRMLGAPGALLGGRWELGAGAMGVRREGSLGQDVQRSSFDLGWERRDIFPVGLATTASIQGRADYYAVQDSTAALLNPLLDDDTSAVRGMGIASLTASYPLVKRLAKSQVVVEPIVGASISPHIDENDTDIPNEDSIDTEFDTNNLFSNSRFPGIDRQEDGARLNYGMRLGAYGDNGRYAKLYVGQSYRFDDDLVFPAGSGLEDNASDIVGQLNVSLSKYLSGDYRFQIDTDNLGIRRHELQALAANDKVSLGTHYIYIDKIAGTGFNESRQQILMDGRYNLDKQWWLNGETLVDMGEEPGLRKAQFGFNFANECFSFSAQAARNLMSEASGDSGTVLMLRVGFKNIGDFNAGEIELSPGNDDG